MEPMYTVIGPDGRETPGVSLATLQDWVTRGQLPKNAGVIGPDGIRREAGSMDELLGSYAFVIPPAPANSAPLGGLIPLNNPKALLAYYLGYTTLFPWLGLFAVPFVYVLARQGLNAFHQNPTIKGKGHAITGIIFASIGLLINLALWILVIAALLSSRR